MVESVKSRFSSLLGHNDMLFKCGRTL